MCVTYPLSCAFFVNVQTIHNRIVRYNKHKRKKKENNIYNNDNLLYIWTNQLYVINRLIGRLKHGSLYESWELNNDPQSEFINKEFENMLAGLTTNISITVPNDISVC